MASPFSRPAGPRASGGEQPRARRRPDAWNPPACWQNVTMRTRACSAGLRTRSSFC